MFFRPISILVRFGNALHCPGIQYMQNDDHAYCLIMIETRLGRKNQDFTIGRAVHNSL